MSKQCIPTVETWLKKIKGIQAKLTELIQAAQEEMKRKFDKVVNDTPQWRVGKKVWLNNKNMPKTQPSS